MNKKRKNLDPGALWIKLTNVELSDLSVETIHTACPIYPHLLLLRLHGCISQAQMGFSAMSSRAWHALNNGRQMTSWLHLTTACAETASFLCAGICGQLDSLWVHRYPEIQWAGSVLTHRGIKKNKLLPPILITMQNKKEELLSKF